MPPDEFVGWVAWFQLKNNPEPDDEPEADNPEAEYAAMRRVLN